MGEISKLGLEINVVPQLETPMIGRHGKRRASDEKPNPIVSPSRKTPIKASDDPSWIVGSVRASFI